MDKKFIKKVWDVTKKVWAVIVAIYHSPSNDLKDSFYAAHPELKEKMEKEQLENNEKLIKK